MPDSERGEAADPFVSIIIPLYNEEGMIEKNLATLAGFFDRLVGTNAWHFLLVENGSKDNTARLADAARVRWPLTQVIHLPEPNYGVALRSGLQSATTRWVYVVDIEQWDLPFIAWAWKNRGNYDVLMASKRADPTINEQQLYRRLLSCGLNGLLQVLLQFTGTDTHGPKLIDRVSLKSIIDLCCLDRGHLDTELVLRAVRGRKRIIEVPFHYREMRPNRNWMFKKIVWNAIALKRLIDVMRNVPFEGSIRYYRLSREEVLEGCRDMPTCSLELDHV